MLEFVCSRDVQEDELFITLDSQGAAALRRSLDHALRAGHDHLASPAWAGSDLTVMAGQERTTFNKVTITFVADGGGE